MRQLGEIRARARAVIGPVIGASLLFYIGYHAIQGERGLIAFFQLSRVTERAHIVAQRLSAQRLALDNRVRLLHPQTLDTDMLEEQARIMLGYAYPDERVILTGK